MQVNVERKRQLKSLLGPGRVIRYSRHVRRSGTAAFRGARRRGYEGIMAKRAHGPYASGRRTREWLKIKTGLRQEVVIVGYTRPQRSRQYFGALVLAVRQGGKWKYVGRAGTGFDRDSLKSIHARLVRLRSPRKPIDAIVPGERSHNLVRPRLVCEVKFTEWTADGQMRHPAFVGLRTDKPARSMAREKEGADVSPVELKNLDKVFWPKLRSRYCRPRTPQRGVAPNRRVLDLASATLASVRRWNFRASTRRRRRSPGHRSGSRCLPAWPCDDRRSRAP